MDLTGYESPNASKQSSSYGSEKNDEVLIRSNFISAKRGMESLMLSQQRKSIIKDDVNLNPMFTPPYFDRDINDEPDHSVLKEYN